MQHEIDAVGGRCVEWWPVPLEIPGAALLPTTEPRFLASKAPADAALVELEGGLELRSPGSFQLFASVRGTLQSIAGATGKRPRVPREKLGPHRVLDVKSSDGRRALFVRGRNDRLLRFSPGPSPALAVAGGQPEVAVVFARPEPRRIDVERLDVARLIPIPAPCFVAVWVSAEQGGRDGVVTEVHACAGPRAFTRTTGSVEARVTRAVMAALLPDAVDAPRRVNASLHARARIDELARRAAFRWPISPAASMRLAWQSPAGLLRALYGAELRVRAGDDPGPIPSPARLVALEQQGFEDALESLVGVERLARLRALGCSAELFRVAERTPTDQLHAVIVTAGGDPDRLRALIELEALRGRVGALREAFAAGPWADAVEDAAAALAAASPGDAAGLLPKIVWLEQARDGRDPTPPEVGGDAPGVPRERRAQKAWHEAVERTYARRREIGADLARLHLCIGPVPQRGPACAASFGARLRTAAEMLQGLTVPASLHPDQAIAASMREAAAAWARRADEELSPALRAQIEGVAALAGLRAEAWSVIAAGIERIQATTDATHPLRRAFPHPRVPRGAEHRAIIAALEAAAVWEERPRSLGYPDEVLSACDEDASMIAARLGAHRAKRAALAGSPAEGTIADVPAFARDPQASAASTLRAWWEWLSLLARADAALDRALAETERGAAPVIDANTLAITWLALTRDALPEPWVRDLLAGGIRPLLDPAAPGAIQARTRACAILSRNSDAVAGVAWTAIQIWSRSFPGADIEAIQYRPRADTAAFLRAVVDAAPANPPPWWRAAQEAARAHPWLPFETCQTARDLASSLST